MGEEYGGFGPRGDIIGGSGRGWFGVKDLDFACGGGDVESGDVLWEAGRWQGGSVWGGGSPVDMLVGEC